MTAVGRTFKPGGRKKNMKLFKGASGGIVIALAIGVFYTFAFCMVEDLDDDIISEEYYYSETEPLEQASAAAVREEQPETEAMTVTEAVTEAVTSAPVTEKEDEESSAPAAVSETAPDIEAVTEVPKPEETEEPETAAENYFTEELDELDDGSSEASERSVYGADTNDGYVLSEEENIDDIQDTEAPETEVPETETTEAETEFTYDDFEVTFYDGDIRDLWPDSNNEETSVSVSVSVGADISTSETFTARINGSAQTVNAYDLICRIVNNEVSPSFSDEAIKAQAVASYSYVKYHNVNGLTPSVLVKNDPPERIKNLVSEVWGVCCYYNGSVAQTVYMASSSGYTADAEHVWGGSVPYLKSVSCPFDADSDPNYGSELKVSESKMRSMLESSLGITLSGNPNNWLIITGFEDGNYVSEISVDGQKTISGRKLRESVMGHELKSAAFNVFYSDGYFNFTTYGYGHGVGMSQNGANILAKQGYSYSDILRYYFTGIEVL